MQDTMSRSYTRSFIPADACIPSARRLPDDLYADAYQRAFPPLIASRWSGEMFWARVGTLPSHPIV
jgi:hypothetical protein